MALGFMGSKFKVYGFRILGLSFRVYGFRVDGLLVLGLRTQGLWYRV